jgi:DNA-binding HxlR family transcriptional regulator
VRWSELGREPCSVARTLSVIGDRWTLLILRDCFLRVRRFDEFQQRLGITRHVLAARLRKLVQEGVLQRVAYRDVRTLYEYRLTDKGLDLYPVMMALVHWGNRHKVGKKGAPMLHTHKRCGHDFAPVVTCSQCGTAIAPRDVIVHPGPGASRRRDVHARPKARSAAVQRMQRGTA